MKVELDTQLAKKGWQRSVRQVVTETVPKNAPDNAALAPPSDFDWHGHMLAEALGWPFNDWPLSQA
jgi:hypothetical protein